MGVDLKSVLRSKALNGWSLFGLISIPICIAVIVTMNKTDLSVGSGVSEMIGYSVRFAVPLIYLVVAASAVQTLFPGPFPAWWLRNRKYIGLSFAVAMAWQGLFIFMMSNFFRDYYYENIYLLRDELEGSVGYIFLPFMVLTSFAFARKRLTAGQWKLLHTSGIYFLWAYPFSVYWWNLSYYKNPELHDYIFYWAGFLAFGVRIAAWGKTRLREQVCIASKDGLASPAALFGILTIIFGLIASATGPLWQEPVTNFLTAPEWSAKLLLWLPFWPFEPFLPLLLLGLGTYATISSITLPAAIEPATRGLKSKLSAVKEQENQ